MIKIIFFDIDGTLVNLGTTEITPGVKHTLAKLHEKGIKLFIATGRPAFEVPKFDGVHFDGIMSFNGSYCVDEKGVIYANALNKEDVQTLIQNAKDLGHIVQIAGKDNMVCNGYEENLNEYFVIAKQKLHFSEDFDTFSKGDLYQMMVAATSDEYDALLKNTTKLQAVSWWPKACDIIPKDGGKGKAIENILKHYGYLKEESMAFGDGGNDKDMLMAAGCGVAMGNARDEVKAIADYITDDVKEDGITTACIRFGLIE